MRPKAGLRWGAAVTTVLVMGLPAVASAAPLAPLPIPDPPKCGIWGCTDSPPDLGVPIPDPGPEPEVPAGGWTWGNPPPESESLMWVDFDRDSVPNWADNCLLVPNQDQVPATKPADGSVPVSPEAHNMAVEWKSENPNSNYRLADQLGEACSSYNENWRLTYQAFRTSSNERKRDIFKFMGEGGPMFGPDNMVLAVPTCSTLPASVSILELTLRLPVGSVTNALAAILTPAITDHLSCSGPFVKLMEDVAMLAWAGKHQYQPTNEGGTITNRFLPLPTDIPQLAPLYRLFPWLFPAGDGQTVQGRVSRGAKSTLDGKDAIVLDWRAVGGAGIGQGPTTYPVTDQKLSDFFNIVNGLGNAAGNTIEGAILRALPLAIGNVIKAVPPLNALDPNYLIYDACRAVQEGFWACTVQIGAKRESDHIETVIDEAWMPMETLDPSIINHYQWEATHLADTTPERYGLPPQLGLYN